MTLATNINTQSNLNIDISQNNLGLPITKSRIDGSTGGPPLNKDQANSYIGVMINADSGRSDLLQDQVQQQRDDDARSESTTQMTCRICLCEAEQENPLICPCKCAGSMGAIH